MRKSWNFLKSRKKQTNEEKVDKVEKQKKQTNEEKLEIFEKQKKANKWGKVGKGGKADWCGKVGINLEKLGKVGIDVKKLG